MEHIAKHNVHPEEVEEVADRYHRMVRVGQRRYELQGQTRAGRYLVVFLDALGGGEYFVVTAREMTESEQSYFRKWL
jgi:uncharacterized DUF497 family protein